MTAEKVRWCEVHHTVMHNIGTDFDACVIVDKVLIDPVTQDDIALVIANALSNNGLIISADQRAAGAVMDRLEQ